VDTAPLPWYARQGSTLKRATIFGALGFAAALGPSLAMGGFTVDDALVTVRYAQNLASGAGYRFDPGSPSSDGVTPLPYPFVLALMARGDALDVLARASLLGAAAWASAGVVLGVTLGRSAARPRDAVLGLVVLALAFPVGAWAASGMETGLVTALATLAAANLDRPRRAAALAGLAAAFRPELVPWATAIALGAGGRAFALPLALAWGPFVACAAVRLAAFGRAAPLAVLAKPSDLSHGARYAAAALVVTLLPLLAFAPLAIARAGRHAITLSIAVVVHAVAVVAAGGDWMPYARLMVPVVPSLTIAYVLAAPHARAWSRWTRSALSVALGLYLAVSAAPRGRGVHAARKDLIMRARPVLATSHVVAALDIGWVSAATNAKIVDLAGLTDESIAVLSGGHTSKRVDAAMLLDRSVDTVVVYSVERIVEQRLTRSALFAARFERREELPLGDLGASYVVYRRR
jgi:hypothetical protein